MASRLPALFVSHGAPDLVQSGQPAAHFLAELGRALPRPERIIVVSAHWIATPIGVTSAARPELIYDFYGFPDQLYEIDYPAPGDPALAQGIVGTLEGSGIAARIEPRRGLDHGAWVPLRLLYPQADIPVVQVSLPSGGLHEAAALGRALGSLRDEKTLLLASGGSTHNLRALAPGSPPATWAVRFEAWLKATIEQNQFETLLDPQQWPAEFSTAHPTLEHYAPLLVAWAAGDRDLPGRCLHSSFDYGNIGMSCFAFGEQGS